VSRRARIWGSAALVVTFVALEALVVGYGGLRPQTFIGVEIGALLGLISLVLEMQIVGRAMRMPRGDTAAATFQTFAMRLALVAPLTLVFQRTGSNVDGTSFAVSYLVTFFVYLCWLTWKTYHAPVQVPGQAEAVRAPRRREEPQRRWVRAMNPILASVDPFEHTWNTWELDLVFTKVDLRTIPDVREARDHERRADDARGRSRAPRARHPRRRRSKRALAEGRTPRGIAHAFEVVVEFIRDQIVKPQMPHHYEKPFYNSFFCTIFFFVLCNNLIGLAPAPFGHTRPGSSGSTSSSHSAARSSS